MDRLDRLDVDKTKVMASNGIACHILNHNEQLWIHSRESLITEYGECTTEFCTR